MNISLKIENRFSKTNSAMLEVDTLMASFKKIGVSNLIYNKIRKKVPE